MTPDSDDPVSAWKQRKNLALLTDFYELTMLAGYVRQGLAEQPAVFEYFYRTLPPHTGLVIQAGLEQFLDYLANLHVSESDLAYLETLRLFDHATLDYLKNLRCRLDVSAVPEGTPVFPHEPILRVTGPLAQAQLVEAFLLNALNYPSLAATKTARICQAAAGDPVMEFGLRRAQGPDGGLAGSRAAYLGGAAATSNTLAGKLFGIPVRGTQAHSWIMSFADEKKAFEAFADAFPEGCALLVDTYDTLRSGVPHAIEVFQSRPHIAPVIRIDSGDLAKLSKAAHAQFAEAGLAHVQIIGTNDLDEDLIADLKRQGAKINLWGVGTHLITSKDHPALDGVYKMVAVREAGRWKPRIKLSGNAEKASDPGIKRLIRCVNGEGQPLGDVLLSDGEPLPQGPVVKSHHRRYLHQVRILENVARTEELLRPVMKNGQLLRPHPALAEIRDHALDNLRHFPEEYLRLRNPEIYWVGLSPELAEVKRDLMASGAG